MLPNLQLCPDYIVREEIQEREMERERERTRGRERMCVCA